MIRLRLPTLLLFLSVSLLAGFGVVMLYSTTAAQFDERMLKLQIMWIGLGLVAASALYLLDYRVLTRYSPWILGAIALPLGYLALLHLMYRLHIAPELVQHAPFVKGAINGAFRWLTIGGRTVQPSEYAKVAIILFMAWYYGGNPRYVESVKMGLLKPMFAVGAVTALILLGGSLSITVITGTVVMAMLFIAGIRVRWFLLIILVGLSVVLGALHISPERMERITSFKDPEAYAQTSGYQLWSSQLAMGSGHLTGVGFNQSRMKQAYLPEAQTDFILAIVGEELGFVAIAGVVALYLLLLASAYVISAQAPDRTGLLLAFGVGTAIALHAFVNLGVVSGFLPTTGVTAPLISYGGSSMVVTWICIGILGSIARVAQKEQLEAAASGRPAPLLALPTA